MIGAMQLMVLWALLLVGRSEHFGDGYQWGLAGGALWFAWQQWLIRDRDRTACLRPRDLHRHPAAVLLEPLRSGGDAKRYPSGWSGTRQLSTPAIEPR
jgi:hypothetical protein